MYDTNDDGSYTFLGSTMGSQVMKMLCERKKEMGYRVVKEVIVLGS